MIIFLYAEILTIFKVLLPFAPLFAYCITGVFIRRYLWIKVPGDARQVEFDRLQTVSLTLTGFCFTSLSLLVSFFKDEIKAGNLRQLDTLFVFACALIAFIASYSILRFRKRLLVDFAAGGLLDNGLWCILLGMWSLFDSYHLSKVAEAFAAILVLFAILITRSLYNHGTFSKRFMKTLVTAGAAS